MKKLKIIAIDFEEILGFSNSEVYFGRYTWKSKSLIIYTKKGDVIEVVNAFVSNIIGLEKELRTKKIKYFGFENYQTGLFFRKYKFNNKH